MDTWVLLKYQVLLIKFQFSILSFKHLNFHWHFRVTEVSYRLFRIIFNMILGKEHYDTFIDFNRNIEIGDTEQKWIIKFYGEKFLSSIFVLTLNSWNTPYKWKIWWSFVNLLTCKMIKIVRSMFNKFNFLLLILFKTSKEP